MTAKSLWLVITSNRCRIVELQKVAHVAAFFIYDLGNHGSIFFPVTVITQIVK